MVNIDKIVRENIAQAEKERDIIFKEMSRKNVEAIKKIFEDNKEEFIKRILSDIEN